MEKIATLPVIPEMDRNFLIFNEVQNNSQVYYLLEVLFFIFLCFKADIITNLNKFDFYI